MRTLPKAYTYKAFIIQPKSVFHPEIRQLLGTVEATSPTQAKAIILKNWRSATPEIEQKINSGKYLLRVYRTGESNVFYGKPQGERECHWE